MNTEEKKEVKEGKKIVEKPKPKMEKKVEKSEEKKVNGKCEDKKCPFHGGLKVRGRNYEGYVTKIRPKRVVIEFERTVYYPKYERYAKSRTRIHAHLPDCMANKVKIGDLVRITECRPLSKIIHHVVVKNLMEDKEEKNESNIS